jgi:prepilin-type N-terminal cleavage/methylation domain-containing protein
MNNRRNKAFTLVEIMIVVLIIGILMAIAVPNFISARTRSQTNTCISNLKQIEGAKEQWAMVTKAGSTGAPTSGDLAPEYIKVFPSCPTSGTYTIGTIAARPTCNQAGHALP